MGKTKAKTKPITKYERRRDIDEEQSPRYALHTKIDSYHLERELKRQQKEVYE